MPNFNKYIGLPYRESGRSIEGVDCFGLIRLIYKEVREIELPGFEEVGYNNKTWHNSKGKDITDNIGSKLLRVNPPYGLYDGIIFYKYIGSRIADHIGMYLGNNKFIHIEENSTSMISRLESTPYEHRIYAALRYNGEWN